MPRLCFPSLSVNALCPGLLIGAIFAFQIQCNAFTYCYLDLQTWHMIETLPNAELTQAQVQLTMEQLIISNKGCNFNELQIWFEWRNITPWLYNFVLPVFSLRIFTLSFRSFSPLPGVLEFLPGQVPEQLWSLTNTALQDYYFISTSQPSNLANKVIVSSEQAQKDIKLCNWKKTSIYEYKKGNPPIDFFFTRTVDIVPPPIWNL